jgi:hypothetical protein
MRADIAFALIFPVIATMTCAPTEAAQMVNAKSVVAEQGGANVDEAVRKIAQSNRGVAWIAYDAPVNEPNALMCCFSSIDEGQKREWKGGSCSLVETSSSSFISNHGDGGNRQPVVERDSFSIFLRVNGGVIDRVRTFSSDCRVDAGGLPVHHLGSVKGEDSVVFLNKLLDSLASGESKKRDERGHVIAAISLHRATNSISTLSEIAQSQRDGEVRGQAAFWLGMKGGDAGRTTLRRLIDSDGDDDVREQAIAGIAQDDARGATDLLLALAKSHPAPDVRKGAIFWLGQRAGERATAELKAAADDPDDDVRESAVFAISQLPAERAIPELIDLARTHKSKVVREQAIFWLGQSGDSRALDFIEEVLTR